MFRRERPDTERDVAAESEANLEAITAVVTALAQARSASDAVRIALTVVRERFDWAYGSHWQVDPLRRSAPLRAGIRRRRPEVPRGHDAGLPRRGRGIVRAGLARA